MAVLERKTKLARVKKDFFFFFFFFPINRLLLKIEICSFSHLNEEHNSAEMLNFLKIII